MLAAVSFEDPIRLSALFGTQPSPPSPFKLQSSNLPAHFRLATTTNLRLLFLRSSPAEASEIPVRAS
ncbi:hypothetical protein B0H10DRAFT_2208355 [Mycena sp. CBHHK59/15]|nr:hypothetical protein B0H10DRAFT_2208355 [Mycena sp. CBHHK59/15]